MVPDLVKLTEIFLVPSSFIVAALGTAETNWHKSAVSALGLVISVLWLQCAREAHTEISSNQPEVARVHRIKILARFPWIFISGWAVSLVIHLILTWYPAAHV
jgi:hypothetical protein